MYIFLKERLNNINETVNNNIDFNSSIICDIKGRYLFTKNRSKFSNLETYYIHNIPEININEILNKVIGDISNYIISLSDISNWCYSFYVNIMYVITEKYNNNYLTDDLSKSKLSDYYTDLRINNNYQLVYAMQPIRVSLHYQGEKARDFLVNSEKLKTFDIDIINTTVEQEQIIADKYLNTHFLNSVNSIKEYTLVNPTLNISVSNITKYLYSTEFDISDKNNNTPRIILFNVANIIELFNGSLNQLNNVQNDNKHYTHLLQSGAINSDINNKIKETRDILNSEQLFIKDYNEKIKNNINDINNIKKNINNLSKSLLSLQKKNVTVRNINTRNKKLKELKEKLKNLELENEVMYDDINTSTNKIKELNNRLETLKNETKYLPKSLFISYGAYCKYCKGSFVNNDSNITVLDSDDFLIKQKLDINNNNLKKDYLSVSLSEQGYEKLKNIILDKLRTVVYMGTKEYQIVENKNKTSDLVIKTYLIKD